MCSNLDRIDEFQANPRPCVRGSRPCVRTENKNDQTNINGLLDPKNIPSQRSIGGSVEKRVMNEKTEFEERLRDFKGRKIVGHLKEKDLAAYNRFILPDKLLRNFHFNLSRTRGRREDHLWEDNVFYHLTLDASTSYLYSVKKFWDDDYRERLVQHLTSKLLGNISSRCCSNYKRNKHKRFRIFAVGSIEHFRKEDEPVSDRTSKSVIEDFVRPEEKGFFQLSNRHRQRAYFNPSKEEDSSIQKLEPVRTHPHGHAVVAVHKSWNDQFISCFQSSINEKTNKLEYFLQRELFDGPSFIDWKTKCSHVHLNPITEHGDGGMIKSQKKLMSYITEHMPEEDTTFQTNEKTCGFFTWDGMQLQNQHELNQLLEEEVA